MRATVESSDKFVEIGGVKTRIWEGVSDDGVPFLVLVTRVLVSKDAGDGTVDALWPRETARLSAEEAEALLLRLLQQRGRP